MASIVLSSVGASVGNSILPGIGGRLLGSLGHKYGRRVDEYLGWSSSSSARDGKRLENFKIQDSSYGVAIPLIFGRARVAGNVIWVGDLVETAHETSSSSGGGKGGGASSVSTTYTYSLNVAVAIGAGEIGSVQTIWADSKIIYQNGVWTAGVVAGASFHRGTDDQGVDPLLESWIGAGLVPAYKGIAYVVLEGLQLANFGNRLPNLTFEVLPKDPTGKPEWLGMADPNIYLPIAANRGGAAPPLVAEGGSLSARRVIVGGYKASGSQTSLYAVEYDVTGDAPVEIARSQSAAFTGSSVGGLSWAMAADKRFVAVGLQDGGTGKPFTVALYDSQTRQFGTPLSVSMEVAETRQVAWIDAQRFLVMATSGGARGVRVFMRSGLSVVDLGFFDVWGAGSQTSRVVEMYAQFVPYAGGLLHFVVDSAPAFSLMEARPLVWKNNALSVGALATLMSGVSAGTGNGGQAYFLRTGEAEWTFLYLTTIDMRMVSFVPSAAGFTITRPWQTLSNASFGVALCHAPVLIGDRIVLVQRSSVENFYRLSEVTLGASGFSLTTDGIALEGFGLPGLNFGVVSVDSVRLLLSANWGTLGDLGRLDLVKRRNTGDTLDNVVAKILRKAGYESGDFDVAALAGLSVDGYVVGDRETGASALEPLRTLAPFELVESGGQLKAVLHGAGAEVLIAEGEAGASEEGGEASPRLIETRAPEISLPVELGVDYEDATRDYEKGTQRARRAVTKGSLNVESLSLPLVLSPTRAKRIAQDVLFKRWSERTTYRLFLSRAWLGLEPGDVATLGEARLRVTETRLSGGVIRVDGVACPLNVLTSASQAEGGSGQIGSLTEVAQTFLYLMDLPLLRAEDDQPGFYFAASGLDGWPGASLWRAADGANFSRQATIKNAAVSGSAASVLPARSPYYRDRESVLKVQLLRGELSSCNETNLLSGANAALVGAEIIQFRTATLAGPGLYALSNLLRGRKGTEDKVAGHTLGEPFVLLSPDALQFLPAQLSDRGATHSFRAVSNGQSIDVAQDLALTYGLKTLEPLAPVHLKGVRDEAGNLTLSWTRRARKNAAWVDYIDVPLDEDAEFYDVEILSDAGEVLRTLAVAAASAAYTAAQQAADFGAAQASVSVRVYQKSSRYGRGKAASGRV